MKNASITRITRSVVTDLDRYTIYHLCFWTVFYSSGTIRIVKGYSSDSLTSTQRKFLSDKPVRHISPPLPYMGESALESRVTFY